MKKEDIDLVSKIFYEGFWGKFRPLHDLPENKAVFFLKKTLFSNEDSLKYYYVAIKDGKVAGILKIIDKDHKEKYGVVDNKTLFEVGIFKIIKTGILMMILEEKVKLGELYIDSIAVSSDMRGNGIGSILLEYSDIIAKEMKDIDELTLNVIEGNDGAKKLYEKHGYEITLTRKSKILKRLSGIGEIYYMRKSI
jgi:ribosomal protein S18 acetylase RimI-like enzyme